MSFPSRYSRKSPGREHQGFRQQRDSENALREENASLQSEIHHLKMELKKSRAREMPRLSDQNSEARAASAIQFAEGARSMASRAMAYLDLKDATRSAANGLNLYYTLVRSNPSAAAAWDRGDFAASMRILFGG